MYSISSLEASGHFQDLDFKAGAPQMESPSQKHDLSPAGGLLIKPLLNQADGALFGFGAHLSSDWSFMSGWQEYASQNI
jgi:hypothetical protein